MKSPKTKRSKSTKAPDTTSVRGEVDAGLSHFSPLQAPDIARLAQESSDQLIPALGVSILEDSQDGGNRFARIDYSAHELSSGGSVSDLNTTSSTQAPLLSSPIRSANAIGYGQIPIDPVLLADEVSGVAAAVPDDTGVDDEDRSNFGVENQVERASTVDNVGNKVKRLTVAEKVEKHGVVQGVMRGELAYQVVRQNQMRKQIVDGSSATARFNRELGVIISKAERVAHETDAYVLLLAQQATGSSAVVHFTSERLRREAFNETSELIDLFQSLITSCVLAKRATTLALARNLEAAEKAQKEVERELAEKESVVANTTRALQESTAQLSERENALRDSRAELVASRLANKELLAQLEALKNTGIVPK
ncbi:hypothetical protein Agabi119p4_10704 [Agaricus bisporus var. burnettii]|uniref:Uncharacterized protein n=1 Tax=Agaricus bisporus var. burnettii TaxID=192524 RepID=A0A8H7C3F6_AGABI|nr:hypothetical protein Agabi119p4_10704 [Agaricus bisporus var. burnettii]